jgi:hypothetical protein
MVKAMENEMTTSEHKTIIYSFKAISQILLLRTITLPELCILIESAFNFGYPYIIIKFDRRHVLLPKLGPVAAFRNLYQSIWRQIDLTDPDRRSFYSPTSLDDGRFSGCSADEPQWDA